MKIHIDELFKIMEEYKDKIINEHMINFGANKIKIKEIRKEFEDKIKEYDIYQNIDWTEE